MDEIGKDTPRASIDEDDFATDPIGSQFRKRATKWQFNEDTDDEYDVRKAWDALFNLRSCVSMILQNDIQTKLKINVGQFVTQQFPWKFRKFSDVVASGLFDRIENGQILLESFQGFDPEASLLLGYAPILTENDETLVDGDPFITFVNPNDAKTALAIIQNIEKYENWIMQKRLVKQPRRWVSLGSEQEVNLTLQKRFMEPVDVEIQSVYPLTVPRKGGFEFRLSKDVRDGYVELLPSDSMRFDNVTRKRITVGIQSAPECVSLEQQTEPTFPTNIWSQYLYEVNQTDEGLDVSSEDEEEKKSRPSTGSKKKESTPKPPPEMSEQMHTLLRTLEFNQIDMYRNEYPTISTRNVERYTNPYLEESLCFANISKSNERYVCGIDWYPTISGLIVTSYTHSTPVTVEAIHHKPDIVQRDVLTPNPILMWSFADNLNYKLEFESPREVTCLSFCPYNANYLFGGTRNGQIYIWDLMDRAETLDVEEILTASQNKYRMIVNEFLDWAIPINEDFLVPPAVTTALEVSQKDAITGIYWLPTKYYINSFGKISLDENVNAKHKYFITCAADGTVAFWNLDKLTDKKATREIKRDRPKALTASESMLKNKVLNPIVTLGFNEPITGLFGQYSLFRCKPIIPQVVRGSANYGITMEPINPPEMMPWVIASTLYGHIEKLHYSLLNGEPGKVDPFAGSTPYARVHDGPVVSIKRNPFYSNVFASIGRNILAVWKEDHRHSPVFWRKRSCDLTGVAWSEDRPSVLFITRIDGNLEAWDILARDDDSCLDDILGGGVVTAISEHRLSEPYKLLGIGDYNSSFRMVKLPQSFYIPLPNEEERFRQYIDRQIDRKLAIQEWEQNYFEQNRDIIEAKHQAEAEARAEMEKLEKDQMIKVARKSKEEEDIKAERVRLPYPERMRRKWDELNMKRLLDILMSRKRVDEKKLERETFLEKKRLAYENAKKVSLANILQNVGQEVAAIRARILPAEKVDMQRTDMIMANVHRLLEQTDDYSAVEKEADEFINEFEELEHIDYLEFLARGDHRRKILNKALGGSTERLLWYEMLEGDMGSDEFDWGYQFYQNLNEEFLRQLAEEEERTPDDESNLDTDTQNDMEN